MRINLVHYHKQVVQAIYSHFSDGRDFTPYDVSVILGGKAQNYGATCRALVNEGVLDEVPYKTLQKIAGRNKVGKRYHFNSTFLQRWTEAQPKIKEILA